MLVLKQENSLLSVLPEYVQALSEFNEKSSLPANLQPVSLQKDIKPSRIPSSHGLNWHVTVIFDMCDFLPPTPMLRSRVPFFPRVMSYTESPLWLCSAGSRKTRDDNFYPFLSMVKFGEGKTRGVCGFHLQDRFCKWGQNVKTDPLQRLWPPVPLREG